MKARPTVRHRLASGPRIGALFCALVAGMALAGARPAGAAQTPPSAAVASAHPLASQAGHRILAAGGNAFDAAVAVSAALAVVEPYSSGLGGGGFWLLHQAGDGQAVMIDGRERAPAAATPAMYRDAGGEVVPRRSLDGPLAAGVPGEPAALAHMAKRYGELPLARSLAPAIRYARQGFVVDERYRRLARFRQEVLRRSPAAAGVFLVDGQVPPAGTRIRQPALADTLTALARKGRAGFYDGPVAQRLVDGVREAGGIWTRQDLAEYRVVEREPIQGRYRGLTITSASPPSSGGVVLIEALNILSGYDLGTLEPGVRKHLVIEAMRRAYRDRAAYLGDPDYEDLPLERLLDPAYAAGLSASIRRDRATPSAALPGLDAGNGRHTTHFSILDRAGNRVAATLSINYPFGSGFMPPGTGVVLNDEMDDFAAKPGVANVYGLVQSEANAVEAGKRPLSSMSPTFVVGDDRVAILGTPGGSRIISMVLLATLAFADGAGAEAMVQRPRYHHQYLPDRVEYEPGAFTDAEREALAERGHELAPLDRRYGNMQAIIWDRQAGNVAAAADPRGVGEALVR